MLTSWLELEWHIFKLNWTLFATRARLKLSSNFKCSARFKITRNQQFNFYFIKKIMKSNLIPFLKKLEKSNKIYNYKSFFIFNKRYNYTEYNHIYYSLIAACWIVHNGENFFYHIKWWLEFTILRYRVRKFTLYTKLFYFFSQDNRVGSLISIDKLLCNKNGWIYFVVTRIKQF